MRRLKRSILKGRSRRGALLLCLFGSAAAGRAQSVLAPMPSFDITPPALLELHGEEPSIVPGDIQLFKWGPVTLQPHLDYQFSYGTGIQSAPGQQQATIVQTFTPGVLFSLTRHWTLDYSPTFTWYSSRALRDTVGQAVTLAGATTYGDWAFSFSESYARSDAPNVATGAQTASASQSTGITASYAFTSKLSLSMSVSEGTSLVTGLQSYSSWSTMEFLNYQVWSRFTVGVGAGVTYDDVAGGPDTLAETYQAQATWRLTAKTSFFVNAGLSDQQYLSGGEPDLVSPIFGAAITYTPVPDTTFTLNANRSISPAVYQQQTSVSSTLNLGLTQKVLKHFVLSVTGTFGENDYSAAVASLQGAQTTSQGIQVNRQDDYYSLNLRLSTTLRRHVTASAFYQYSINTSSQAGFGFDSSQTGFEVGYRF